MVSVLTGLCTDADGGVRMSALNALQNLGGPQAVETLSNLSSDPQQENVEGATLFASSNHRLPEWLDLQRSSRRIFGIRSAAKVALLGLAPGALDPTPPEIAQSIADLRQALHEDPKGLAQFERRAYDLGFDHAYLQSQQHQRLERLEDQATKAVSVIGHAKRGTESMHALMDVFGCGLDFLELEAAKALSRREDKSAVRDEVHRLLTRSDLTLTTLNACLEVMTSLDPPDCQPIARRVLYRLITADQSTWRVSNLSMRLLRKSLTTWDVPAVLLVRAFQTDPEHWREMDELAGCLISGLPPTDELLKLADFTLLTVAQRKAATDLCLHKLNHPERDGYVSPEAVYHLGSLRAREAVPGLIRVVDRADNFERDLNAGWALVQIGDPACIPKLREIALRQFRGAKSSYPHTAALVAYGLLAGERAIDDLTTVVMQPVPSKARDDENMGFLEAQYLWIEESETCHGTLPRFASLQTAAAYTLGRIGGERAKTVLLGYLAGLNTERNLTAAVAEALFRVAPEALDQWSRTTLASDLPWGYNSRRETATVVRITFFPDTAHEMMESLLKDGPSPQNYRLVDNVLRYKSFDDPALVAALRQLLDHPPVRGNNDRTDPFNLRLIVIDAIGRQGGPEAEAALLELATGETARPKGS